jgi:hypothetical protein
MEGRASGIKKKGNRTAIKYGEMEGQCREE